MNRLDGAVEQHFTTGANAFDCLDLQPLFIPAADILADLMRIVLAHAERLKCTLAEEKTGFQRLAQLVSHFLVTQRQRMDAVIGADIELGRRKLGTHQIDDPVRRVALLRTDRDDLRPLDAGGHEHVATRPVAEIDAEAEIGRLTDAFG